MNQNTIPVALALALAAPGLARAQATAFTSAEFATTTDPEVGLDRCVDGANLAFSYALNAEPSADQEVELFSSTSEGCSADNGVVARSRQQEATLTVEASDLVETCENLKAQAVYLCVRVTGDTTVNPPAGSLVTFDTIAPAPPVTLEATGGDTVLRLAWGFDAQTPRASDMEAFVVQHRAQGATDFEETRFPGGDRDGAVLEGLENGTTYDVQVLAEDSYGNVGEPSVLAAGTPQATDDFWEIYRGQGGSEVGCSAGGGSGLLGLLLLLGVLPRIRRRGLAVVLLAGAFMLPASAAPAEAPAPRHWFVELGAGPYRPAVDAEFGGTGPYQEVFGDGDELMPRLRVERALWHGVGQVGVSLGAAFARASGIARFADGSESEDRTRFHMLPLELGVTYRFDWAAQEWNVPLAVYGRAGVVYELWWVTDNTGDVATDAGGESAFGGRPGYTYAAGAMFLLDVIDPHLANDSQRATGIDNSYLFFEWGRLIVDGFGSDGFDLSDDTWWAGLALEF